MPEFVPTIRSGRSVAIFSNANPSAALSTVGFASPSASRAHGQTACGCSPYHSVVATGVKPSARSVSCSVSPTLTIRRGSAGTVVVPNLWSTAAGYRDDDDESAAAGAAC